jgi:hypothetical protein
MALFLPLSLFMFAQGCVSAAISIQSGPTLDLRRSVKTVSNAEGLGRRQVANLDARTKIDYLANVTFGSQTFELNIDTGSSDTWVAAQGFHCLTDSCLFGPQYRVPGTFDPIDDVYLNITYGDKTNVIGPMGYENVTIAGITIPKQVVSIGTTIATNVGDSLTSGLIGLSYPALTHAFDSTTQEQVMYDPIVTTMFKKGLIKKNSFSLALMEDGGKLSFGTLPQGVKYQTPWASAAINPASIVNSTKSYEKYAINVTWGYDGADRNVLTPNVVMDSGAQLASVPTIIANAVNAKFQPPANITDGAVACDAKVPEFGPIIGGQKFPIKAADMILKNPDGTCTSTITPSDDGFILGDVFLRSVLVEFDIGNQVLHFAKRI